MSRKSTLTGGKLLSGGFQFLLILVPFGQTDSQKIPPIEAAHCCNNTASERLFAVYFHTLTQCYNLCAN